jgi:hypothetical protein
MFSSQYSLLPSSSSSTHRRQPRGPLPGQFSRPAPPPVTPIPDFGGIQRSRTRRRTRRIRGQFGHLLLLGCLALTAPPLAAQEGEESTGARQLMFAPPPVEGVISVGVYDARGKLIRTLSQGADIDSFKAGLNGLILQWDGNESSGRPAPPGRYYARGVLVGDVSVDGVAFHLNDWLDVRSEVRPRRILAATLLAQSQVAVLAEANSRELLLLDPKTSSSAAFPAAAKGTRIRGDGLSVLVLAPAILSLIRLDKSGMQWEQSFPEIRDADQYKERLLVAQSGSLLVRETPVLADQEDSNAKSTMATSSPELKPTPSVSPDTQASPAPTEATVTGFRNLPVPSDRLTHCAVLESSLVISTESGQLWKWQDDKFVQIDLGGSRTILDLTAGHGDTVWLLTQVSNSTGLQQVDLTGRQIRELPLPVDLQNTRAIAGSRTEDALLLTVDLGNGKRLVGLRFQNSNERQSVWEKWLDRSLSLFTYFDLRGGSVVPADTRTESAPVLIKPANNPMESTRQPPFQLSALADSSGVWICNSDGLPLFQVCETKNVKQVRWNLRGTDELQVYVSDGSAVEEYKISGLENLYRFDAGFFN